jgi:transposase
VVLFIDNAAIHHHASVLQTCRLFKVNVLFNAPYSPWLNPVEKLFALAKRKMMDLDRSTK